MQNIPFARICSVYMNSFYLFRLCHTQRIFQWFFPASAVRAIESISGVLSPSQQWVPNPKCIKWIRNDAQKMKRKENYELLQQCVPTASIYSHLSLSFISHFNIISGLNSKNVMLHFRYVQIEYFFSWVYEIHARCIWMKKYLSERNILADSKFLCTYQKSYTSYHTMIQQIAEVLFRQTYYYATLNIRK